MPPKIADSAAFEVVLWVQANHRMARFTFVRTAYSEFEGFIEDGYLLKGIKG